MDLTRSALEPIGCWFDTDAVSGQPEMTAFKRRARVQQSQWRASKGYAPGRHRPGVVNGSMLTPADAQAYSNFLSQQVIEAVKERSNENQSGQQFDQERLRSNLLSSMPMCFNLFGELSRSPDRLTALGSQTFGLDRPGLEGRFEWSPGRLSSEFTGDRTAFDVALLFGHPEGPQTVIGIETKYHEHIGPEVSPDPVKRLPRYMEIAEASPDVFKSGWEQEVLGTDLQQIWRDHLLLLSMIQHPSGRWTDGKYVLVVPNGNSSYRDAGERYRTLLRDDSTFALLTIESLLDQRTLHSAETERAFRERYLWTDA